MKYLYRLLITIANLSLVQACFRQMVNSSWSRRLIPWYIDHFSVDISDLDQDISDFKSLQHFFTRKLCQGARPFERIVDGKDLGPKIISSPVDGRLALASPIDDQGDLELTVKGQKLHLSQLLGDQKLARNFAGGTCAVIYLSPANYHRFHLPLTGRQLTAFSLGSRSTPVNESGLRYCQSPLAFNYRIIQLTEPLAQARGQVGLVYVGALNVNSITCYNQTSWIRGQEDGYFAFGSTVILLFQAGQIDYDQLKSLETKPIRAGQTLTTFA